MRVQGKEYESNIDSYHSLCLDKKDIISAEIDMHAKGFQSTPQTKKISWL